jgi:hypothetical protein
MERLENTNHIGDTNKMVTAVEWLLKNLKDKLSIEQANQIISQAKEMEKEQMELIYKTGYKNGIGDSILTNTIIKNNQQ